MGAKPLLAAAGAIIAATVATNVAALACDNDRYLCEPKIAAPAELKPAPVKSPAPQRPHKSAKNEAVRPAAAKLSYYEKAPPDAPRAARKIVPVWNPIEQPSQTVLPPDSTDLSADAAVPAVRVVSADELNDIDLAAPAADRPIVPVKVVAVRVVRAPAQETTGRAIATEAPPPAAPADTTLLERVLVTFGGAFGAASGMRLFFG